MKHKGSTSDFISQRNRDLFLAYRKLISESKHVDTDKLYEELVNFPSARFWVSEERAAIVLSDMIKKGVRPHVGKCRMEMFKEIYKRAVKVRQKQPELSMYDVACKVVNQKAPKFYLTAGTARIIIHYEKKKWYEEKKKRLRFMFQ